MQVFPTKETGWYYLQSRYYDPIVKRFLNADAYGSTGQGFLGYNMFAYCNNNPISSVDPSGSRMQDVNSRDYGGVSAYTDTGSGQPKTPAKDPQPITHTGNNQSNMSSTSIQSGQGTCNGYSYTYSANYVTNVPNGGRTVYAETYSPTRVNYSTLITSCTGSSVTIYNTKISTIYRINRIYIVFQNGQSVLFNVSIIHEAPGPVNDELSGLLQTAYNYCGGGTNLGGIMWAGDGIWITQQR